MIKTFQIFLIFSTFLGNVNCFSQGNNITNNQPLSDKRLLGIALNYASNETFDKAFAEAQKAQINFTTLPINWDDIESSPNKYNPETNFLKIANIFYPANKIKIALELNPIDTVKTRIPKDLKGKRFDDPKFISRFKSFLDWSFKQIPDLELISLSIGNEIDIYLASDEKKWRQFEIFFKEVSAHARKLRPGLKVGTKVTVNGMTKNTIENAKSINKLSDIILTTYYHLDDDFTVKSPETIGDIFKQVSELHKDKPIYFLEIGYPSGKLCDSSEEKQAEFIKHSFESWDNYSNNIKALNFTWLTDISSDSASFFTKYYGVENKRFREYLATLGLRTNKGKAKTSFGQLIKEVKKRKMVK